MDARAPDDENEADNTSAYKKSILTNKQIAGLCLDFMAAGCESTSIALACTSYLLSLNILRNKNICVKLLKTTTRRIKLDPVDCIIH